jgi:hypothetical protein
MPHPKDLLDRISSLLAKDYPTERYRYLRAHLAGKATVQLVRHML